MTDLFISYRNTPERRAIIARLRLVMDAYGFSVWWDYGLEAGKNFEPQILEQLSTASLIIPMWCEESITSEWVVREAEYGLNQQKLLPARLQPVRPPVPFDKLQSQDLIEWDGSVESVQIVSLVAAICNKLGKPFKPEPDKLAGLRSLSKIHPLKSLDTPDYGRIWRSFSKKDDTAAVGSFLALLRAATVEVGLIAEIEKHLRELRQAKAELDRAESILRERYEPRSHNPCPCNSGLKFKDCHGWIDPYLPISESDREKSQRATWRKLIDGQ